MSRASARVIALLIACVAACPVPAPCLPAAATAQSKASQLNEVRQLTAAASFQNARLIAERLMSEYPNDAQVHLAYASLLRGMGLATQAAAEYSRAHILDPQLVEPLIALAQLNLESLNLDLSLHYARMAASRAPGSPAAHMVLAQALLAGDKLSDAESEISRLLADHPSDPHVLFLAYRLNRQLGNFLKSRYYLDSAIAKAPPEPQWLYELADVLEIVGDCQSAVCCLLELTSLQPDSEKAREKLASVYEFTCRDYDKAIEQYRLIIALNPDSVSALAGIDRCQGKKNDLAFELKVFLHHLWAGAMQPFAGGQKARAPQVRF